MASLTQITERKRRYKLKKAGKKRKAKLEKHGSTPKFPIHIDKKK